MGLRVMAGSVRLREPGSGMPFRPGLAFTLLAAILLVAGPASASQVLPINLEEMALRAATIFAGRCVDVRVEEDPADGRITTLVTFAVRRSVKGEARGKVTIRMLGEQTESPDRGRRIEGIPAFRKGEEVVLFLYGESRSGLTSPVGFGQGKFTVMHDKEQAPMAVNAFGNRKLLERMTPRAERRVGREASRWRGRGGIPPDSLLDMAEAIVR